MNKRHRRIIERRDEEFHEAIPASQTSFVETAVVDEMSFLASLLLWVAGVVETVLLVRLLLRLFAANPQNGFVSFIYQVTRPLISPFFGAVGVQLNTGPGSFETTTAVAMVVYGILAFLVVALIDAIMRRRV